MRGRAFHAADSRKGPALRRVATHFAFDGTDSTEPVLSSSNDIHPGHDAKRARAAHAFRGVLFALLLSAAGSLIADDTSSRLEREQIWAGLAGRSTDMARIETAPLVLPVRGVAPDALRESFDSPRSHGRRHAAIDIMAPRNTPIVAAVDGEIRKLTTNSAGGLTIYQFDQSETRVYYYAHLERYREGLRERMFVRRGEIIGYVGSTGNAQKNAPHLHFAIHELPSSKELWEGAAVDPYPLLAAQAPSGDSE